MYDKISVAIKNHYGSKRGMLKYYKYQSLMILGVYNKYKKVDISAVRRLVFVCAGNICRSPFAEAVAVKNGLNTASFGIHCPSGDPADPRAIKYAEDNDYELQSHRTTKMSDYLYEKGDLLVVMEPGHILAIEKEMQAVEITLIGFLLDKKVAYLHDPYNTSPVFFSRCESLIERAVKNYKGWLGDTK